MSQIRHTPVAPTQVEAYAAGHVIDQHRHDNHQLVYASHGVLAVRTARGSWVAGPDRAVWVPGGVWHEPRFYGASAMHSVGFEIERPPLPVDAPTVVAVDPLLRELLIAGTAEGMETAEGRRLRAVLCDRLRRAHVQPLRLPAARDARLARACRLVEDNLARPRPLGRLAAEVGAGERTLARLFRVEFGATYPQWRRTVRIFHAMVALAEGASVTQTAHRCGWATTSAFVDTFARTMGQTPGAYRQSTGALSRTGPG